MKRAAIRLTLECNNECVFCAQVGLARADAPPATLAGEVTFVGGEPTLLGQALCDAVRTAHESGCTAVGVQTNGARLESLASELASAGLTDVHVSLHGARSAVPDYHTGVPGSFNTLMAGLAAARAHELTVVTTTVLTRSNCRSLSELPVLLENRGIAAWSISIPRAAGRAIADFDRVVPRLGIALPFALHALGSAHALGLPAWIHGAPLCALGPFARHSLPDEPRAFGEVCAPCTARPACPGVDNVYLARFGGDELSPRERSMTAANEHGALRRMFTGVGECATARSAGDIPEPPRAARLRLPLLGKVRPGLEEVRTSSERKSGEALREVFPELFERARK